jgi:hypothetical protein
VYRRAFLPIVAATLAALALYAAAFDVLVPWAVERHLPRWIERVTGLPVHVEAVRTDPFRWTVAVDGLRIGPSRHGGPPSATARALSLDVDVADLPGGGLGIATLRADGVRVTLERGADGSIRLMDAHAPSPRVPDGSSPSPTGSGAMPRLQLELGHLTDAFVRIVDRTVEPAASVSVGPIEARVTGFDTRGEAPARFTIDAGLPGGGRIDAGGTFSAASLASTGRVRVTGLRPDAVWTLVGGATRLEPPRGSLELDAPYEYAPVARPSSPLTIGPASLEATDLRLALQGAREPLMEAARIAIEGARIGPVAREASIASLHAERGAVRIRIDDAGRVDWSRALIAREHRTGAPEGWRVRVATTRLDAIDVSYASGGPRPMRIDAERLDASATIDVAGGADARERVADAVGTTRPWRYRFDRIDVERLQARPSDWIRGVSPDATVRVSATVSNVAAGAADPIRFELRLEALPGGGSLSSSGTASQDGAAIRARVAAEGLDLAPLQPSIDRHAALDLRSGRLGAEAEVARDGASRGWRATGSAWIDALRLDERDAGEPVLRWERARADRVAVATDPPSVRIGTIRVVAPDATVRIAEDRSLALRASLAARPEGGPAQSAPTRPPVDAGDGPTPPVDARIERIALESGRVRFVDRSLVMPFDVEVDPLEGALEGLSTRPGREATLALSGRIGEEGRARAEGRFVPSDPTRSTDVRLTFARLPMPLLTPYLATFAGRTIESGRLRATLRYRVVDGSLSGDNRIVATDLALGPPLRERDAVDLPIDLAIALLTDSRGRLSVEVPVTGDLGDPRFDYGALIRDAIATTVRRIASAPFRALARLGSGGDASGRALQGVSFEPGSARLPDAQRRELEAIAAALADRPALVLRIDAPYDPRGDAQALSESQAVDDETLRLLATRRARAIRDALTSSSGIGPERVVVGRIRSVEAANGRVTASLEVAPATGAGRTGPS